MQDYMSYPTWKKYNVLCNSITNLNVREKRNVFNIVRNDPNNTHHTFFPEFGFTTGAFCTWQILSMSQNRNHKNKNKTRKDDE